MSAWEENIEMVSQQRREDVAELCLTESSNKGTPRQLAPLLKQRRSGEESAEEISQRLGPPLSEDHVYGGSRRTSVAGSMSSHADTRSYRERLRDHIQTVKEQAGSSVASTNARLKHSLKLRSPIIVDFQDLGKEESEVEAALEKHEQSRKKWKHLKNSTVEAETAQDFFTKEWADVQPEEDLPSSPKVVSEECGEGDQVKLVTKEYLGLPEDWRAIHCFCKPTIDNVSVRIHRENQLYYYPHHQPVKLEDKLGRDGTPRYIEDEGLFVGPKPVCSLKSYNKLQQRLVTEGRRHWFGEDGELKTSLSVTTQGDSPDILMTTVYRYPETIRVEEPAIRAELSAQETYLLDLEVGSIIWWHHPLSSQEHVAARLVLTRYQEYSGRVCAGLGRRLANKLQALRTARDNVRRTGNTDRFNRYAAQVRETRELRLCEGRKDRAAVVNCLNAWLELRKLRAQQGYIITPVRLNIIELDGTGENNMFGSKNEWDTELKYQVAEYLEEEEENLKNLDGQDSEESEARRVLKRRSASEVVENVRAKLSDSLVLPGEPVVALELGDEPVTPEADITDHRELERRAAQRRCQLVVRVLCNRQVVCRSRPLSLYPDFSSCLNQLFCLQITNWPQSLSLELLVEGGLGPGKPLSASLFIPVPNRSSMLAGASLECLEFNSADKLGPYAHTGVGCGVEDTGFAGGVVTCRVGWGATGGPPQNPPSVRSTQKILSSVGNMRDWVSRAQLDPNDPSNAELFQYIKDESSKSQSQDKQVNGLSNGEFCSMEEIEENPRLKLLCLRNQVVPEFRDLRNIPLREREIPQDIFQMYEKRIQCPVRNAPGVGETALEWQREWSSQQLNLIRDNILQHCRQMQQQHSLHEVVMEDQVPDIGTLGLTFMKWLQPKRPLRPTRKERKKLPVMGLVGQEVEVIVNVVRAFQVPVRMDVDPLLDNGLSLVPVRPFVEVSFQNRKSRTTTAEGANPTWNQDLRIPVKLPSSGFYTVQDKLYCQLYDETIVDLLEDDRQRETNIHQRLQRQWLGSLQIPFSSLCNNARIEGTFHLYSPPVLLGYQRESQQRQSLTELRDSTFLTLFITVNPPLHPPEPFKEQLTCSEMAYMEQHLLEWKAQVYSQVPHRPVKCLVVDTSAKSVCVTRFFRPLSPPVLEEGETTTAEMALRFVSKIPMVSGTMLFPGLFDVWLTAQQVVTLLSGDLEDHAVLLCCYLLSLGLKAWLLLGAGVPHGPTALVFTRDPDTLWDPGSGQRFNPRDSFCPLHRVYCLINQDNIWANVQREEAVSRTRFDVSRRADWWPAFSRSVAAPQDSVQPTTMLYTVSPTIATDTALLQDKLEKTLRDSITKWRPSTRTVWNRYVTVKLRKLLPGLERAAWSPNMSVSAEHITQLSHTLSSYKMCGYTQNFSFTSSEEILEAVKATGLHTNESSDVEFALAVYVHPFVCSVLSVWFTLDNPKDMGLEGCWITKDSGLPGVQC